MAAGYGDWRNADGTGAPAGLTEITPREEMLPLEDDGTPV